MSLPLYACLFVCAERRTKWKLRRQPGESLGLVGGACVSSDHSQLCQLYFCHFCLFFSFSLSSFWWQKRVSEMHFLLFSYSPFIVRSSVGKRKITTRQQLQLRLFRKTVTIQWKLLPDSHSSTSSLLSFTTHQGCQRLHLRSPRNRCNSSTEHRLHASAPPYHQRPPTHTWLASTQRSIYACR